ncbi:MAG TPA: glycosyltransferase family 87 protein [Candidatus Limnocylindrales bacterium]|nr:glycosyltransferase family 87 protein [Candidatus Limnocylindrales bacterium]
MTSATVGNGPLRKAIPFVLAGVGLVLWVEMFNRIIGPELARQHFFGSVYWVGPRLVWEGRATVLLDHAAFAAAAEQMGAGRDLGFLPFAPAAVIPLLPFGLLPEAAAYFAWTSLGVFALFAAVAIMIVALRPPPMLALVLVALLPLFQPLQANFRVGQAYAFVLLALVVHVALSYGAPVRRRLWTAVVSGLAAALIVVLKTNYGLLILLPALISRRWRLLGITVAFVVIAVVSTLPLVGWDGWSAWAQSALSWRARPETSVTAYQTLHSLFAHLLRQDEKWNPAPVADFPFAADALWYASTAVLVGVSAWALIGMRRSDQLVTTESKAQLSSARLMLPIAIVVPVASLISPIAEDYHYLLDLLPIFVGATILWVERPRSWGPWLLFAAALVLLAPAWPFNVAQIDGWWALFFYPRVYGALLLWLALLALRGTRE